MPRGKSYIERVAPFDDPDKWDVHGGEIEDFETTVCGGEVRDLVDVVHVADGNDSTK